MYFLGIDGGGTKTAYIVINENNEIVYEAKSGASSLDTVPFDGTKEMFKKEIEKIPFKLDSCFAGLGGVADDSDIKLIEDALKQILPNSKVAAGSDTVNALFGSLNGADGLAIIAGTGSVAFGKYNGKETKVGAYGYHEGDPGSSFDLGINALRYLARALDGRAKQTPFTDDLCDEINCHKREELVQYFKTYTRTNVAQLARIVTKHQDEDEAKQIIVNSVNGMLEQIRAAYNNLQFEDGCLFSVIGSLGNADTLYKELLLKGLKEINKNIKFISPINEASLGAALKAKELVM